MFQMFRAQVGDNPEKDHLFAMLLDADDLGDDGWKIVNEMAYFSGAGRKQTPEISRARKSGSITAIRRLKSEKPSRLLSLAVIPFADSADAMAYLPSSIVGSARKPFSKVADTAEEFVPEIDVPSVPGTIAYEVRYLNSDIAGGERIIAGAVDNILLHANFRDTQKLWPWSELVNIAQLQTAKLRRSLEESR